MSDNSERTTHGRLPQGYDSVKFFLSKTPTTSNRSHFSFEKLKKITSISQQKQFPLA